jgi:hypothetical protein
MGYLHIDNLYKDDRIFRFDECWALEKIHGTSAHIAFRRKDGKGELTFFSGGESYDKFVALFDIENLFPKLEAFDQDEIIVYGEAYGGKQQGMRDTYGPELKFVAFDVRMAGHWLDVPNAHALVRYLKLEFVDYKRINATLPEIDAERDRPSEQAIRNGITEPKKREGVVLRPIGEVDDERGNRIITKHKNAEFMETKTPRQVDPDKLAVLAEANKIAEEWVTEMRLQHVLDRAQVLKNEAGDTSPMTVEDTGQIIGLMNEDVKREAKGEIVESKDAQKAIGNLTARLFKKYIAQKFEEAHRDTSNANKD